MRISTNQIFNHGLNSMMSQQIETLKLQQQLSSGKKIQSPSDDPIAASQIDLMNQRIAATTRLEQNRDGAVSALNFEESALSNIIGVVQRIRELQLQAGNTSLSEEDRKALAEEAQTLLGQLQGLANSHDTNGNYLFSGSKTSTQPISRDVGGQFVYNGDETKRFQAISSGLNIAINDNGADLFMKIRNGNGFFTVTPSAIPNTGSAAVNSGSIVNVASYVPDDYTLQFVLNTQNQLVVMVSGLNSGPVIPPTGNPDDAPLYQEGAAITFNGIQVTVTGKPDANDSFTIKPSVNESLFSTVDRMVINLKRPFLTARDKATVATENNQILEQLDNALDNLLAHEAELGARLNQLDVAEQVNGDYLQTSEESLSSLRDVNLPEVAVKLELQKVYLQVAQQSFAQIQGLTVFNYL
ncbi:flagellar hook-associated protein FlgL [Legionella jordanis]|uniref:Flagellar hook-associated protein FlgL n=1 Tax=Legionella jordanis TaxID=456 RepID=A0A0W0V9F3_9GAMM|nr:flagellar hook-associated protein FlgL [Legionella jordanis]KTD16265.1 flagellar hook-associated protein FlgL [Legionella jordanis]RMX04521.1 flagellar hook-associated protein 3 [Legionella jordanis]RMX21068.1 flagellar hook-associated protein 3 [Legionella jordanis]VEH12278.1 flagellar hook-associated protein 3 FlgL [Legionella jordanis]HAT8713488.1 flagellar hook-associated protein 3 [Legionella jordanis]